jgi:hypothetical protein
MHCQTNNVDFVTKRLFLEQNQIFLKQQDWYYKNSSPAKVANFYFSGFFVLRG